MSILSSIINGLSRASQAVTGALSGVAQAAAAPASAPAPGAAVPPAAQALSHVDVEKLLTELAARRGRPSNWRVSIVDLMALLDLDTSLAHRRELAKELGYTGSTEDTATMNIWLHKQVMTKLAEHGGTVPAELKA